MNKKIAVTVYGNPIAKKRPRFARRGKFVTTYNPQETEEGRFMINFHNASKIEKPMTGPIEIECVFFMERPKSHYGTGKNMDFLKRSAQVRCTKKPDIDNLLKFLCDSLNGYAWVDDSQIVEVIARKYYVDDKTPRTNIYITEIPDGI